MFFKKTNTSGGELGGETTLKIRVVKFQMGVQNQLSKKSKNKFQLKIFKIFKWKDNNMIYLVVNIKIKIASP